MLQISESEIKDRLQFDNPWWEEGTGISQVYQEFPRREYYLPFRDLVLNTSVNRAVILMGPRRVGKTVMVFHTIQHLIDAGVKGTSILYLSLETPIYTGLSLEKIVLLFRDMYGHKRNSRLYIFFDEIQYLRDWEIHLKSLVDSYSDYRFVATGSAAAALRLKSRESGAGRFTEFMLPPLTFAEYIRFIDGEQELIETSDDDRCKAKDIDGLNREFVNYLNYGGYPEAVFSELIRSDSSRYIKSDIVDKVLLRDLPSLYGISDIQELNRLFTTIAYNTGNEITLEALAQSSGVAKNTLKRYLEYLEAAFLIKRVYRIDQNARRFERITSFKAYLTNPSMRAALFGYLGPDSEAMGNLAETAILSQWLHSDYIENLFYARWQDGEIDIVALGKDKQKPNWAVEVKWSDRPLKDRNLTRHLVWFMRKHGIERATVTTRSERGEAQVDGAVIEFIPSSEQAYILGRNILRWYTDMHLEVKKRRKAV